MVLLQAFSLNAVNPTDVRPGGVARNFVSRDLLEARSLEDAVQVIIQRLRTGFPEIVFSLLKLDKVANHGEDRNVLIS
jgi:hypothetical protein